MKNIKRNLGLFTCVLLLSGCASLGKGITEAILEKQDSEDTRLCQVTGEKFTGLKPQL